MLKGFQTQAINLRKTVLHQLNVLQQWLVTIHFAIIQDLCLSQERGEEDLLTFAMSFERCVTKV